MKQYFLRLLKYNQWANARVLDLILKEKIRDEEIIKLFSHILNAEFVWLSRASLRKELEKGVWQIHNPDELSALIKQVASEWETYLNNISDSDLEKIIHYYTTSGQPFSTSLADIIAHVINHGTYHRGQINKLAREKVFTPVVLDYIVFVRE
ncbi:MAG: DinB family protein [Cytophagaceae bacterium]|nr:DinB family protein [Cytophagaceae bacterium]